MDLQQLFSASAFNIFWIPVIIGIFVIIALYFLRYFLYKYVRKLTVKTTTTFDDIMVRDTRIATLLWCIWLGVFTTYKLSETPQSWINAEYKIIPVLFVAIGLYTLIMVFVAIFKWYRCEICPGTGSSLDDYIMGILIYGTPILGGALGIIVILNILGYSSVEVNTWLAEHGPKIGLILVLAVALLLISSLVVPKMIERAVRNARTDQTDEELKKRADTLVSVVETTIQVVLIFMFLLMVLTEVGINVTAILTGAGVVGLAVGFGAQSLVKDVISGLFIIMENQYRKGDVVKIADTSGVVEEINLRRTILRDLDGITHTVPNGEIRVASNFTKQWSRVNMNISVAYDTDLDKAMAIINRVGKELAEDPQWASSILTPPRALRVDKLGDSGIEIKVLGETKPVRQWDVMGELRLRLKKAFDEAGIEIPWPHTKVYFGNQPPKN